MKVATAVVTFFVLVILAVVACLPATLADSRLGALSSGRLRIAAASGTLWNGQGALTDAKQQWQLPLAWSLDPLSLVRGDLKVALTPLRGAPLPEGVVIVSASGVTLRDFRATLPAGAIASLLPLREAPALGGDVAIDANEFRWSGNEGQGTLKLSWQRARLATAAGSAELGLVEVLVTPQGQRLAGRVSNTGGEVRIGGTVTLSAAGNEGDLTIASLPGAAPAVARALANLGTPDASGAVRLTWRNNHR